MRRCALQGKTAHMRQSPLIFFFLLCLLLPACNPGSGLIGPSGERVSGESVNQMVVAQRLAASGEHELALRAYLRAAAENGATAEILTGLGSSNLALGRLGQAEEQFRIALERDSENIAALNNLGVLLLERDKPGESRGYLSQAFALDSGRSDEIRSNLQLAIARSENSAYTAEKAGEYVLIRQGGGTYRLSAGSGAPQG